MVWTHEDRASAIWLSGATGSGEELLAFSAADGVMTGRLEPELKKAILSRRGTEIDLKVGKWGSITSSPRSKQSYTCRSCQ